MTTLATLEDVALFADLTMDELVLILPLCAVKEGSAGEVIIQEGARVRHLYILLTGNATVKKARADGKMAVIARVGKNDLLGEVTFFKNTPGSATVEASSSFYALEIEQTKLHRLLDQHPALGLKIYKKFARILSRRITHQLALSVAYLPAE